MPAQKQRMIVCENFYDHPDRFQKRKSMLENYGLRLVQSSDEKSAEAHAIVIRTREFSKKDLKNYPNAQQLIVVGTNAWMVHPDIGIPVHTFQFDRGLNVAEHAISLLLTDIKGNNNFFNTGDLMKRKFIYSLFFRRTASEIRGAHNWLGANNKLLFGKNIGILGYGLIGRQIHTMLRAFRSNYSSRPSPRVQRGI